MNAVAANALPLKGGAHGRHNGLVMISAIVVVAALGFASFAFYSYQGKSPPD
jgi:hypothetical protein